jgi:hypothetical protein
MHISFSSRGLARKTGGSENPPEQTAKSGQSAAQRGGLAAENIP